MKTKGIRMLAGIMVMAGAMMVIGTISAQAFTFTFDDVYFITGTTSNAKNAAGQTNFNTVFGAANAAQYVGRGFYQETDTTTPIITRINAGVNFIGAFIPNTTPNADSFLLVNGFTPALVASGQPVNDVFNSTLTAFLRYHATGGVGGATSVFTFNSFQLWGSGNITIQGENNLNPVAGDLITLSLTSTPTLYTFNWTGIDTVDFISGLNGGDQIFMDNVTINEATAAVPEPATMLLLGSGLLGLAGYGRKKFTKK
jgi:hypothetical protein